MSAPTHIFQSIFFPDGSTIPIPLVPLPRIENEKLQRLVFTHKSARTAQVASRNDLVLASEQGDYEKLAHIGDALLGCAVVLLLHQLYPNMSQGAATNLKGKLVDESALNYLSRLYDLPHHLKAPASALEAILASSRNVAEIFEAYVAAIFYDNIPNHGDTKPHIDDGNISQSHDTPGFSAGFSAVLDFLLPLYTPVARGLYDPNALTEEEEDKKAEGAMGKLHSWLGKKKAGLPQYPIDPYYTPGGKGEAGKVFVVQCKVSYKHTKWSTTATRSSTAKAKNVAAWKAIEEMRRDPEIRGL